jgi:hypothetical protein
MGEPVEIRHVSLGGQIDPLDWAYPCLDDEHASYAEGQLRTADALLLGRRTDEGLCAACQAMAPSSFVDRMDAIPKFVGSARWGPRIHPPPGTPRTAGVVLRAPRR